VNTNGLEKNSYGRAFAAKATGSGKGSFNSMLPVGKEAKMDTLNHTEAKGFADRKEAERELKREVDRY